VLVAELANPSIFSKELTQLGRTEIVDPLVEIEMPFVPTIEEVCGTEYQIVDWPAPVDWDAVIAPDPAKTIVPLEFVPVFPAVLPVFDTPTATPPAPAPTEAVTIDPALVPQVTLLAFEKLRVVNRKLPALFDTAMLGAPIEIVLPLTESET
jgi:hypothetical protein